MVQGSNHQGKKSDIINSDCYDRWCIKKVDDRFGLKGEPRFKAYVDVMIGTPRKVSFEDKGRLSLEGENVSARVDGSMTQVKAHHIVSNEVEVGSEGLIASKLGLQESNEGGSLMCYSDGTTKNKKMGVP